MTYSIRLPESIEVRLENLSVQTGRTKKFYVMLAIENQLDDLEDLYLAERELEEIRAGRSIPVPLAEVMKRYGMEG
jgi:RHH-type transcriptional regulator, rel operon repressor / antitoxin RelB